MINSTNKFNPVQFLDEVIKYLTCFFNYCYCITDGGVNSTVTGPICLIIIIIITDGVTVYLLLLLLPCPGITRFLKYYF